MLVVAEHINVITYIEPTVMSPVNYNSLKKRVNHVCRRGIGLDNHESAENMGQNQSLTIGVFTDQCSY